MSLGFRLFGNFHWPPLAHKRPVSSPEPIHEAIREGLVEIFFLPKYLDYPNKLTALLRWCPGKIIPKSPDDQDFIGPQPDKKTLSLFDLTQGEQGSALAWWSNTDEVESSIIWLDGGTNSPATEANDPEIVNVSNAWTAFHGAFLLQQFEDKALNVQWPLVSQCEYISDITSHSSLVLYRIKKTPQFRFNVHLPLPVQRRQATTKPPILNRNEPAFPFCAIYNVQSNLKDKGIVANSLVVGWIGAYATKDPKVVVSYILEPENQPKLKGKELPSQLKLGRYGFAPSRDENGRFAKIYRELKTSDGFWPADLKSSLKQVLENYGFGLGEGKEVAESLEEYEPNKLSLRFGNDPSTQRQSLIYRISVKSGFEKGKGDLSLNSKKNLQLKLEDELGGAIAKDVHYDKDLFEGWLSVGKRLFVDCELSWSIAKEDIWSFDRSNDWGLKVKLRIIWSEVLEGKAALLAGKEAFSSGLLQHASYSMAVARNSMIAGESGLPHSFLPSINFPGKQSAQFCLYGTPVEAVMGKNGLVSWGKSVSPKGWRRSQMRLTLADPKSLIEVVEHKVENENNNEIDFELDAIAFFQTPGVVLNVRLKHDNEWPHRGATDLRNDESYFASYKFELASFPSKLPWAGRLSALQFSGEDNKKAVTIKETKNLSEEIKMGKGLVRVGREGTAQTNELSHLVYPNGTVAVKITIPIPVSRIEQIGIDTARADRSGRPAPLLVPMVTDLDDQKSTRVQYWLIATEKISPREDRWLQADIYDNAAETGDRSYVSISQEPFSILKFTSRPLSDRGSAESASVATYSGDTRLWQYKTVSDYYHYVLPPQVVGESADKPRRLEIHDLTKDDEQKLRPYVSMQKGVALNDETALRRRAVEFRLTPSAEIWIKPSDVKRGYFMPESTSYEIFRQYGEYGLGAQLAYLRAEFLYGMPVGIDVAKEMGIARASRVAEIEALTGRLPGHARQGADKEQSARWNSIRAAFARRPERLEIWARDLDSTVDFTPARFSTGVQFALRGSAVHRHPIGPDSGYKDAPLVGGEKPTEETVAALPRHHPQGLSGGALWPVESLNLFNILIRSPASSGGTIEHIALSPIGGDASQRAEFLDGKVAIISETRNGHVERQQVEVLGRICTFWHRAKHVVVYERTVNATAQFAPLKEDDPDRTRSRRPILRKVREYIELLQPERNYPDFTTAHQRTTGFLERVRFNSNIINVDSAWSSDVENFGWKIPLWNRLSSRQRPQVYPLPDIAFVTTAEGEGERPIVAQECLDPDYLFFFADFKAKTSDTNLWEPRLSLDFPNMPVASEIVKYSDIAAKISLEKDGVTERRRRAVGRFLPGLRQFTWRLAPVPQKTAINAGRAGKPVYVGLETVTFMRASHVDPEPMRAVLVTVMEKAAEAIKYEETAETLGKIPYWKSNGEGSDGLNEKILNSLKNYTTKDGTLGTAIGTKDVKLVETALANLETDLLILKSGISGYLKERVKNLEFDDLTKFNSKLPIDGSFCDKLKKDAVGMVQRKEMLIRTVIHDLVGDGEQLLDRLLVDIDGNILNKEAFTANLVNSSLARIKPLFNEASQDIGNIDEGVEKVRSALFDLESEIEAVFKRSRQRIEQFVSGYDQSKPWSVDRRNAFHEGLTAAFSNVPDDIRAAIDETRQRMGIELNNVSQAIGGYAAKFLTNLTSAEIASKEILRGVVDLVDPLLIKITSGLNALNVPAVGSPKKKIEKLLEDAGEITDADLKDKTVGALDTIKNGIEGSLKLIADGRAYAAEIDKQKNEAVGDITKAIDGVKTSLEDMVKGLKEATDFLFANSNKIGEDAKGKLIKADIDTFVIEGVRAQLAPITGWIETSLSKIGTAIDAQVLPIFESIETLRFGLLEKIRSVPQEIIPMVDDVRDALQSAQLALAPGNLVETLVRGHVIEPAVKLLFQQLPDFPGPIDKDKYNEFLLARLMQFEEIVGGVIKDLNVKALEALTEVTSACKAVYEGLEEVTDYFQSLAGDFEKSVEDKIVKAFDDLKSALGPIDGKLKDAKRLFSALTSFDYSVRSLQNNLSRAYETANVYADRVFDLASKLKDGDLSAAPSNILKLYSAVTSAPELAALKSDIDRIRAGFDELGDVIDTTEATALFNQLGDGLKALGLSFPFDKISDRIMVGDLSSFDIGQVFRGISGFDLSKLLKGQKVPAGVRDAIKVTHDFDKKRARAWVQVDINAPMPGRRSLFSVGVFKAEFVDMHFVGQVRLEASKDQDKVSQTGFGRIGTKIDMVVGGQSMVSFEKFGLNFTKEKGLDIEFDPANIRLNPQFKFIQDFLSTLFGDEPGGLKIIKEGGMPVGIEHEFIIPPVSLNFGTSGVSNISIENRFKLIAYPDFMLADRFNLSTVERPFIFSIFIIGGTGFIQIEAQYRPFDNELLVLVEAGAGGSASLAFAFGPFSGQIFITLSGTLSYRKLIGKPGGGLSISVVLVIAGHVNVAGIVTIGITLMLRMTYRDNGQVDADGTLSVTIRISKFFKLRARANVKYKLRGGKSESKFSSEVGARKLVNADLKNIQQAARKLEQARN